MLHLKSLPDIYRDVNLITLLVSEDEGSHRYVSNVLSDPVHLGHHPVHTLQVLALILSLTGVEQKIEIK